MKFGMEVIYKTLSTKHEFRENLKSYIHGPNFVITIWGEGGGAKSTIGIRNFNLLISQFRKKWKIGQSQYLINVSHFSPTFTPFSFVPLQLNSQKNLFLSKNKILGQGGGGCIFTHFLPGYTCGYTHIFFKGENDFLPLLSIFLYQFG
jgi:hypothetical protein